MKKTTSFLLFIVVAVGMLAACQPTAEAPVVDNSARIAELEAELETLREASGDEADARIAELEAELAEAQAVVPEAPEEEEEEPLKFAFLVFLAGSEGWNLVRAGMEDAIAAFDLNVDLGVAQGPTDWDAVQQLTILQQVIATEPDAILITAADSETMSAPTSQRWAGSPGNALSNSVRKTSKPKANAKLA
jgi:ABC-type sugar transport system substrate-binding protein